MNENYIISLETQTKSIFLEIDRRLLWIRSRLEELGIEDPTQPFWCFVLDRDPRTMNVKAMARSDPNDTYCYVNSNNILNMVFEADSDLSLENIAQHMFVEQKQFQDLKRRSVERAQKTLEEKEREELVRLKLKYE